jgi:hypothetical protein
MIQGRETWKDKEESQQQRQSEESLREQKICSRNGGCLRGRGRSTEKAV